MNRKLMRFAGRHYETGSVHNALALQGVTAPHTKQPYSEALLLGVRGGIAFGYFTFEYKGHLPQAVFLTRNTFDPLQTLLERLGVEQRVYQTTSAKAAEKNLRDALAVGPVLVWADEYSLPYTQKNGAVYWNMIPVVVFGVEEGEALIADRSAQPFRVPMEALTKARARVKDDRFRIVSLASPLTSKLVPAIQKGIWQCISLFTDKPPKGARRNFGFAAYEHLAEMLVNKRNKQSWERLFPAGPNLYNAVIGLVDAPFAPPGLFSWIQCFGLGDGAERAAYADFLDEAAVLLEKKSLKDAAQQFRVSRQKWTAFADALLPSNVSGFDEVKTLLNRKHQLFVEMGEDGLDEITKVNSRLKKIEGEMMKKFPLSPEQAASLRAEWREHVLGIAETEKRALELLQESMK
ncbi:MAG: hypothetical protein DPW18_08750 [Chloroflexi bacterium]|nr:hypothetical protein [Chloroflexota bacterium]MDL1941431.1 DUF4872 domain-containing protein [Chloroflexi bacterium CFX2]